MRASRAACATSRKVLRPQCVRRNRRCCSRMSMDVDECSRMSARREGGLSSFARYSGAGGSWHLFISRDRLVIYRHFRRRNDEKSLEVMRKARAVAEFGSRRLWGPKPHRGPPHRPRRCAHPVMRISSQAKTTYISIASTLTTTRPAKTSAMRFDDEADIIR